MLRESHVLLISIFIAGLCSIVYELLIATTGSYFLGDSITQFSLTIGIYMAFMGVGSYISRWVTDKSLLASFIGFELLLALLGGACVPILYYAYAAALPLQLVSGILTAIIGVLIGLEIPLLSRLMEKHYTLKANLANVLSIDYFGALIATLVFPLLLLPWLGVFKTSLAFGLVNLSIALTLLWYFYSSMPKSLRVWLRVGVLGVFILLAGLMWFSKLLNEKWNETVFDDQIVHSEQSQYQQLIVTRYKDDIRLFLNGGLQFSSIDEYRYHESLIHPAMTRSKHAKSVLVLGGGDGLAVRELLKYSHIDTITLVDLDPAVAALAKTNHYLTTLNQQSLSNDKVNIIHQDGFVFAAQTEQKFDLIVVDLPDPKNISLARLYSKQFYLTLKRRMNSGGIMVTQATSPFFATQAFWSIYHTVVAADFKQVLPYHVNIPSFGEWGFVMACHVQCQTSKQALPRTRFFSDEVERAMAVFPNDMIANESEISTLDNPSVLHYYLAGWKYWH